MNYCTCNDAYHGRIFKLHTENNGKYSDLVQMTTKFSLIIVYHLKYILNNEVVITIMT